jgi:hypothetical protein
LVQIDKLDAETLVNQDYDAFMFRCILRLEIKAHECYCEGIGHGGDRKVLSQGKSHTGIISDDDDADEYYEDGN